MQMKLLFAETHKNLALFNSIYISVFNIMNPVYNALNCALEHVIMSIERLMDSVLIILL